MLNSRQSSIFHTASPSGLELDSLFSLNCYLLLLQLNRTIGHEMEMLENDETLDRLSDLHESLIIRILGFLPMRDVVRTTILSKRWKDLWLTLPVLNFYELGKNAVDSRNFINRALMLWEGHVIQRVDFVFRPFDPSLFGDMDLWLRFATRRKVEELRVKLIANPTPMRNYPLYSPPQCLYSCSSITMLWLMSCYLEIRGNLHWHQLKSLVLSWCYLAEGVVIDQVVSSCPRLEILRLILFGTHENLTFQSTTLKILILYTVSYAHPPVLTICAPNLEVLVVSGAPIGKCLLMDVSSLTVVTLLFVSNRAARHAVALSEIITALREVYHVRAVTLSSHCYKMLSVMDPFSPLMGVKLLRFCGIRAPLEILGLLKIFPKLETLIVNWRYEWHEVINLENHLQEQDNGGQFHFGRTYPESLANELGPFLMQLKTVEIDWHFYEASIFQFVEILLKHATMIEKIVIQKRGDKVIESEDLLLAAKKVKSAEILPKCEDCSQCSVFQAQVYRSILSALSRIDKPRFC